MTDKGHAEKPLYRTTELNTFEWCHYAYYLEHIEKSKGMGNFYTCQGSACHVGRKVNLRQKIKSQRDMPLPQVLDAARDEVVRQFSDDFIDRDTPELSGLPKSIAAGKLIDRVVAICQRDYTYFQRHLMPIVVERRRVISLADWPFDISVIFDSIDNMGFINDLKTSQRKWSQARADKEYQPGLYWLAYRAEARTNPKGFKYQILTISEQGNSVRPYIIITHRTDKQIRVVLERVRAMHESIKSGVFPPTHQSNWKCSPRWCRFYRQCKYTDG